MIEILPSGYKDYIALVKGHIAKFVTAFRADSTHLRHRRVFTKYLLHNRFQVRHFVHHRVKVFIRAGVIKARQFLFKVVAKLLLNVQILRKLKKGIC